MSCPNLGILPKHLRDRLDRLHRLAEDRDSSSRPQEGTGRRRDPFGEILLFAEVDDYLPGAGSEKSIGDDVVCFIVVGQGKYVIIRGTPQRRGG
jgi:hypothetical protein